MSLVSTEDIREQHGVHPITFDNCGTLRLRYVYSGDNLQTAVKFLLRQDRVADRESKINVCLHIA